MIHQRWYEFGTVFGIRYLFDRVGEGLAKHKHPTSQEHNVIILRGSIQVSGWSEEFPEALPFRLRVNAPAIVEIPETHELTALEAGTEILNLNKYGKPPEYDNLPEAEKDVVYERDLLPISYEEFPTEVSGGPATERPI